MTLPPPAGITAPTAGPDQPADAGADSQLHRLRRLVREQFADAVSEGRLDIDLANGMLTVFGLPELPRRWTVRLSLTFTCEVTAGTEHEAYDTAEDALTAAVTNADCPIDIDYDSREQYRATPGDIDHNTLEPEPDPQ